MSASTLDRLLSRLLGRFLKLFLSSIRRFPPCRLISHLFSFLASLRRWTVLAHTTRRPILPQHQLEGPPAVSLNSDFICAMNVPRSSDDHEFNRPSPVDLPYINTRSPSGHLAPYSPTPTRSYSRDRILWITNNQTPLYEEPDSIVHGAPHVAADSILRSSSSTTVHTDHGSRTPRLEIPTDPSRPPTPLHTTIGFGLETLPGNPGGEVPPQMGHVHFTSVEPEYHRSKTPLSMMSSQRSISQRSFKSGNSIGRASYREHHGPPGRVLTPVPDQGVPVSGSSSPYLLRGAELGGSAAFETNVALPSAGDPDQPGDPVSLGLRFFPMSANGVLRYENRKIRPSFGHDYNIEAMSYQYPETLGEIPEGWVAYRHPEGVLYFVHRQSKTFTEVDVCNEDIHGDIEHFRTFLFSELEDEIMKRNLSESLEVEKVQLVLEPKVDEYGVMCCYYFVNPRTRSLFWLDQWEGYEIFKDVRGVFTPAHKGLAIQAHYWCITYVSCVLTHWNLYPNFCDITQELKDEVIDTILHAICDHLTSNRSSLPLNPEELKNHLSLIKEINPERTERRGHCAVIIGRIMHIFYDNYFLNFHGEECARLNFDHTVHGWRYHPSLRMTILAPLLFMTPVNNVRLLHRVFVDDIASKEKWNMFVSKLNSQLQETSVLATVLLNADVGFLQVLAGVNSVPQFLTYMSLVASMASIILGLVFMGHSRTEARNTPFEAATFLHGLRHERHGLETLAIIYSLPHAFLMWGMVLFFAAFAAQWCLPGNTIFRSFVGVLMLVVTVLAAWCIWTVRDQCHFWWFQPDPKQEEYQKPEEEEKDDKMSLVVPKLWFLRGFTMLRKFLMTKPLQCESHAMDDAASFRSVPDPRRSTLSVASDPVNPP